MGGDAKSSVRHHRTVKIATTLATNLRAVRKAHGYTQQEFVDAAGVAATQIANGEKNRFQIPASRLCRISLATGIPVLEFFRGIDLLDFAFGDTNLSSGQSEKVFDIIQTVSGGRMSEKQNRHAPRKVSDLDTIIGKNIRDIRKSKDYSQKKLGKELGVTSGQMCLYEKGGNRLPAAKLCRLSQILHVPLLEFLQGIDLADHKIHKTSLDKGQTAQILDIIDEVPGVGANIRVLVLNNPET